jgi:hypothetical protein
MKRQPKPFSVEIKRSRRSGSTSASTSALSPPVAFELERADAEEAALPPKFILNSDDFDLVVPEFLKSSNGSRRLSSKENSDAAAKDREKVFAPSFQQPDQTENRAPPRVLQSLEQPEADHFSVETAPTKRTHRTNEKGEKLMARKARVTPKTDAVVASVHSGIAANPNPSAGFFDDEEQETKFLKAPIEPQLTRPRIFLKNGRADAATLPPGQRWKRRLHPRTW